ncbi:SUMF1/EgtB/PvdO family nonheme iron enzyme [Nocardia sp. NPDC048505]|uniref:SUMF1/EgtB/PvdO family nonheme iron enzyme n=1 Tax=Nocardia sp. NPDC048505 TaxID=3155756 RepID=UPI0033F0F848
MITMLQHWTAVEVRALQAARRMSNIEFGAHLGVAPSTIERWVQVERPIKPRPVNQAALDTSLRSLTFEERRRFTALVPDSVREEEDTDLPEQPVLKLHPVDGKTMAWIPEGIYLAGAAERPVWVAGYWIDVFPVTNADFARFVSATGHPAPQHWEGPQPPQAFVDHPVVWVTYDDATSYAEWARKQLPTSAQWEKAARGIHGDLWPWGNAATPAKCNSRGSRIDSTTPVDQYKSGASVYGVFDLCGNTWEWQSTRTTGDRYELKGGSFSSPFDRAAPAAFNDAHREMLDNDTGFRCVATAFAK